MKREREGWRDRLKRKFVILEKLAWSNPVHVERLENI
jgi:hypothetical protein